MYLVLKGSRHGSHSPHSFDEDIAFDFADFFDIQYNLSIGLDEMVMDNVDKLLA